MPLEINASLPLTVLQTERFRLLAPTKQFKRVLAVLIRFRELTFIRHCIAYCSLPPAYSSILSLTHPSVGTLACRNNRFCDRTDGEPCALFQNRKPLAKANIYPHLRQKTFCLRLLRPIKTRTLLHSNQHHPHIESFLENPDTTCRIYARKQL